MKNEKIIIIGGGVGPQAGTLLHNYIIDNTQTNGTDQDHLDIYHFSRSSGIPDRTDALEKRTTEYPAKGMYKTFTIAARAVKESGKQAVGGIPCNTFHAPEIINKFYKLMIGIEYEIKILNMIEETVQSVLTNYPGVKKIGIMSTTGTRKTGVYKDRFELNGLDLVQVPEELQSELHDSIYNKEWGIKAISPVSKLAKDNFEKYAENLINNGAELIILGCTEIPLALPYKTFKNITLIDPMVSLARALIREANPSKLKKVT